MKNLLNIIITGLLAILIGLILSDREFYEEINNERMNEMEKKLQGKLLPSITINGRTTIWTRDGEIIIQEVNESDN